MNEGVFTTEADIGKYHRVCWKEQNSLCVLKMGQENFCESFIPSYVIHSRTCLLQGGVLTILSDWCVQLSLWVFFVFWVFLIYLFHWGCSDVTKGKIWITVYLLMGRNAWSRKKADFYLQTCVASAGWQLEQRHLSVQNEWISFGCFWGKINMETSESWCCSYKATFWAETHFNPKLV